MEALASAQTRSTAGLRTLARNSAVPQTLIVRSEFWASSSSQGRPVCPGLSLQRQPLRLPQGSRRIIPRARRKRVEGGLRTVFEANSLGVSGKTRASRLTLHEGNRTARTSLVADTPKSWRVFSRRCQLPALPLLSLAALDFAPQFRIPNHRAAGSAAASPAAASSVPEIGSSCSRLKPVSSSSLAGRREFLRRGVRASGSKLQPGTTAQRTGFRPGLDPAPRRPAHLSLFARATWHHASLSTDDSPVPLLMAWRQPSTRSQAALIEHLQRMGVLRAKRSTEAMATIDRALYVGDNTRALAYQDCPQPIGFNATISAPHMHAQCLDLLDAHLKPGSRALDVGSGTGYLTACFAVMVGTQGKAVGLEHIPELVEMSMGNVSSDPVARPFLESGVLELHAADGRRGWPQHSPYHAIHVGPLEASTACGGFPCLRLGTKLCRVGLFGAGAATPNKRI